MQLPIDLIFISENITLSWSIKSILKSVLSSAITTQNEDEVKNLLTQSDPAHTMVLLDIKDNNVLDIERWLWEVTRIVSTAPFIAIGFTDETTFYSRNVEFEDLPAHHKYVRKPINLYSLCKAISKAVPISPDDKELIIRKYGSIDSKIQHLVGHDILKRLFMNEFEDCIKVYDKIKNLLPYSNIQINMADIENEMLALKEHRSLKARIAFANKLIRLAKKASNDKIDEDAGRCI